MVFKSLARFNTQFKVKESFKLSLGKKSENSLATKPTLNFFERKNLWNFSKQNFATASLRTTAIITSDNYI